MTSFSVIRNSVHIDARNMEQTIWRVYTNCATLFECIKILAQTKCNLTETQEDVPVRYEDSQARYDMFIDANPNEIQNLLRIINEIDNNITTQNRVIRIGRWNEYIQNDLPHFD